MDHLENSWETKARGYFDAATGGHHVLLVRTIEHVKALLPARESTYCAVLVQSLQGLTAYVNEVKAEQIPVHMPVDNLGYMEHETEPGRISIKEKWTEGVWKFNWKKKPVYIGNFSLFHAEYDDLFNSVFSFIITSDKEHAISFLDEFHAAKWRRNRETSCVLHYSGDRMDEFRKMDWRNIFLSNNLSMEIKGEIDTFFSSEDDYKKYGLDWKRGMMLAGRPGNGKTLICRAVATTAPVPVIYCSLDCEDMFRILEQVNRTIRANAPCITIFEDADTLGSDGAVRSAFLNMLDGLFSSPGVFTIASTNAPDKLDEAFTGRPSRFDSFYIIPDPATPERMEILMNRLGNNGKRLKEKDVKTLVADMSGLSAACVQEVAVCALMNSFKTKKPLEIGMLKAALLKIKKHLRASDEGVEKAVRGSVGFTSFPRQE